MKPLIQVVLAAGVLTSLASAQGVDPDPALRRRVQKPYSPMVHGPSADVCPPGQTNLCIPLDGSFSVVDMNEPGGSGPADPTDPCQRNDDDSGVMPLNGWTFDLFGTSYSEVYINNNGNLSFGQSYSTYSPVGFPVADFPMVAPFWADVDTGDVLDDFGGVVYARQESVAAGDAVNRLTVIWDHVGYYDEKFDKLNTFEVIISDGQDPLVGIGDNVCLCFDDMQWTTGDASGGTGGFGGSPATVGVNHGNGTDFFLIGLFDHAGTDYDGPGGGNDGVSYLDDTSFCFSVASSSTNVAPVFLSPPACAVPAEAGGPTTLTIEAIGPEIGQTVDIVVDAGGLANFSATVTPGNPASAVCSFSPDSSQIGRHPVTFTATDDGAPPESSMLVVEFVVSFPGPLGSDYCAPTVANSTGALSNLRVNGSDVATVNELDLQASDLPAAEMTIFLAGLTPGFIATPGGSLGNVCLTTPDIARVNPIPVLTDACGLATFRADLGSVRTNPPQPVMAGQTWYFQAWHQDAAAGGSNFTQAVAVMFF